MTARTALGEILGKRLIVCLGPGGVGKTTVAAALAVAAARHGRRTAVLTVDPARRLREALGLRELRDGPHPVPLRDGRARLDALALDVRRTFDAVVRRLAPDPAVAERILRNRLYQELAEGFAGSAEYMAMERVYTLAGEGAYECVVVDTPPSTHAADLLHAPGRVQVLLGTSAVRILKAPTSLLGAEAPSGRMVLRMLLGALQRWTGLDLLRDLSEFAAGFEHLATAFRDRAGAIAAMLRDASAAFVVVTTAEPEPAAAAARLAAELEAAGFPLAGVIVNRIHAFPAGAPVPGRLPPNLRRKLRANYRDFLALTARDRTALRGLQRGLPTPIVAALPVLPAPPLTVAGLERLADLLGSPAPP